VATRENSRPLGDVGFFLCYSLAEGVNWVVPRNSRPKIGVGLIFKVRGSIFIADEEYDGDEERKR